MTIALSRCWIGPSFGPCHFFTSLPVFLSYLAMAWLSTRVKVLRVNGDALVGLGNVELADLFERGVRVRWGCAGQQPNRRDESQCPGHVAPL